MDRNYNVCEFARVGWLSLSARRAWIEILLVYLALIRYLSLSARRAWIEIVITAMTSQISVSLSARRAWIEMFSVHEVFANFEGRSPQGERG